MPAWIIEMFAEEDLTLMWWVITCMPLPVWVLMIVLPHGNLTRKLANPFFYPLLLCPVVAFLYHLLIDVGIPSMPQGWRFTQSKEFITHPLVLMIFWAKLQIMHLFLGITLYRDARQRKMLIPVTLIVAWFSGPLALMLYALRLILHKAINKKPRRR